MLDVLGDSPGLDPQAAQSGTGGSLRRFGEPLPWNADTSTCSTHIVQPLWLSLQSLVEPVYPRTSGSSSGSGGRSGTCARSGSSSALVLASDTVELSDC
jgi:hypothetical protein